MLEFDGSTECFTNETVKEGRGKHRVQTDVHLADQRSNFLSTVQRHLWFFSSMMLGEEAKYLKTQTSNAWESLIFIYFRALERYSTL